MFWPSSNIRRSWIASAQQCRFSVAAEKARELGPSGDTSTVAYLLDVTAEAVDLLTEFPDVTIGGARDVRNLVQRAAKGARLQPAELLQVLDMVSAARNLRRALLRLPEVETRFPHLREFADHLAELPDLETDINRAIGPRGDVLDTASAELGRIRRDVRVAHSRLMERLNALVSGGKYASVLQDSIVTTRDGRYVVPVRADARAQLQGVVHDTSASGQTLFVEPFEIVELNNRWRERQLDEQHEIDRILDLPQRQDRRQSRGDLELRRSDCRHRPGHGKGASGVRHARAPAGAVVREELKRERSSKTPNLAAPSAPPAAGPSGRSCRSTSISARTSGSC